MDDKGKLLTAERAELSRTVTAAVARGRTVMVLGRRCMPGELVELPDHEHARLLGLGFLENPNAPSLTPSSGPHFQGAVGGVVRPA